MLHWFSSCLASSSIQLSSKHKLLYYTCFSERKWHPNLLTVSHYLTLFFTASDHFWPHPDISHFSRMPLTVPLSCHILVCRWTLHLFFIIQGFSPLFNIIFWEMASLFTSSKLGFCNPFIHTSYCLSPLYHISGKLPLDISPEFSFIYLFIYLLLPHSTKIIVNPGSLIQTYV